jgi:hypothetical protein
MSPEDNKVTVRRFYDEVINQKNLAVLEELMGDHYVSHDLPSDPAALKGFSGGFHSAFPCPRACFGSASAGVSCAPLALSCSAAPFGRTSPTGCATSFS